MRRMFSLKQLQEIADNRVKTLVEGGTLENAKAIYFHPIVCLSETPIYARITFIILDNNPTAYTTTTFKAKAKALMDAGAILQVNGFAYDTANSHNYQCYTALKAGENSYKIEGNIDAGATKGTLDFDDVIATVYNDGVNKIN